MYWRKAACFKMTNLQYFHHKSNDPLEKKWRKDLLSRSDTSKSIPCHFPLVVCLTYFPYTIFLRAIICTYVFFTPICPPAGYPFCMTCYCPTVHLEHRGLMLAFGSEEPCEAVTGSAVVVADPTARAVPPGFVAIAMVNRNTYLRKTHVFML